jgi:regulator of protease activity HflC (stomatin/prohibitin superfamily)
VELIGLYLKDVVESAIRHRIANLTIDEVLRKRATLILELKNEMSWITEQWGLEIDTFEIKSVRILSAQVFSHLQAPFRDAIRLDAERSALEAERTIAERKLAVRLETERAKLDADHTLRLRVAFLERERFDAECAARAERAAIEERVLLAEVAVHEARREAERLAKAHATGMAALDAENRRCAIEAENLASPALALVARLPEALGALKVQELNLGDAPLARLISRFGAALGAPRSTGEPASPRAANCEPGRTGEGQ